MTNSFAFSVDQSGRPSSSSSSSSSSSPPSSSSTSHNAQHQRQQQQINRTKIIIISFWVIGLLNNSAFVIMLAGAKSISEGGTGLVFIANTLPSLLVKLSAPYWYHLVGYGKRIIVTSILFSCSFCTVAYFSTVGRRSDNDVAFELIGVAMSSLGGGIGESSLLALGGKHGKGAITAFSSGTGFAGVFGFAWRAFWNDWLGFNFTFSLLVANVLSIMYAGAYFCFLREDDGENSTESERQGSKRLLLASSLDCSENVELSGKPKTSYDVLYDKNQDDETQFSSEIEEENNDDNEDTDDADLLFEDLDDELNYKNLSTRQRFFLVLSLWPYMIPLFLVYFAEYALQSGAWTAIGFPVDDTKARDKFYEYSNWTYQIGVFLSRSSGTIFQASLRTLWILPFLQVFNLVLFILTAIRHFWYDWSLLIMTFGAGLLGGGVYVNAYTRIHADMSPEKGEFALASASVADSFGILLADVCGLFIQSCLYQSNNIDGAVVVCPL